MVRPEQLVLQPDAPGPTATVSRVSYHGHDAVVELRCDSPDAPPLLARLSGDDVPAIGTRVAVATTGRPHIWVRPGP
jgi:hypothetical protein